MLSSSIFANISIQYLLNSKFQLKKMTIRFILIYFFTLLLAAPTLSGQETVERRFKGGIVAGFNLSQIEGDQVAGYDKIGLQAGARVAIVLKEKMDLGIEMLFSQRGSAARNQNQGTFPFKLTLNYVEVPVIFNYMDWKAEDEDYYRLHFHTGFSYGRLIGFSADDNQITELGDFFRDNDVSWIGGATYYVNENLGITARYTRSIYPFFVADEMTTPNASSLIGYQITFQTVYMF